MTFVMKSNILIFQLEMSYQLFQHLEHLHSHGEREFQNVIQTQRILYMLEKYSAKLFDMTVTDVCN